MRIRSLFQIPKSTCECKTINSELRTQNSECLFRYKCKAIIIFVTNK